MYFNCSPYGLSVEETFATFVPEYLVRAAEIADKNERRHYLQDNMQRQFDAFRQFVQTRIADLVDSFESYSGDRLIFDRWVYAVAKKHEKQLLKKYVFAMSATVDKKSIEEFYRKKFSRLNLALCYFLFEALSYYSELIS